MSDATVGGSGVSGSSGVSSGMRKLVNTKAKRYSVVAALALMIGGISLAVTSGPSNCNVQEAAAKAMSGKPTLVRMEHFNVGSAYVMPTTKLVLINDTADYRQCTITLAVAPGTPGLEQWMAGAQDGRALKGKMISVEGTTEMRKGKPQVKVTKVIN